jgi:hypothetical protein
VSDVTPSGDLYAILTIGTSMVGETMRLSSVLES